MDGTVDGYDFLEGMLGHGQDEHERTDVDDGFYSELSSDDGNLVMMESDDANSVGEEDSDATEPRDAAGQLLM